MSCHTELAELEGTRDAIVVADEDAVAEIHAVRAQLARYTEDVRTVVNHPSYALPFLQPGRLVRVRAPRCVSLAATQDGHINRSAGLAHTQIRDGVNDFGWGCVVNFSKKRPSQKKVRRARAEHYVGRGIRLRPGQGAGRAGAWLTPRDALAQHVQRARLEGAPCGIAIQCSDACRSVYEQRDAG